MEENKKAANNLALTIDKRRRLCSWGANGHGQLGIGSSEDQLLPVKVIVKVDDDDDDDRIVEIGGGGGFSCILMASGTVLTCGNNDKGQLAQNGQVTHMDIFRPWNTLIQVKVVQLAAGWDFMLALLDDGSISSWGSNAFGQLGRQLGLGAIKYSPTPEKVFFPKNVKQTCVAAGLRHALSLSADGTVFAWGHGRRGQLGSDAPDGKSLCKSDVPVVVSIQNTDLITSLFAGMYYSGALTTSGGIFLWGCNKYGQCCINPDTTPTVNVPSVTQFQLKEEVERIIAVCTGWTHVVAKSDAGRLYSWGRNDLGQLGRLCEKDKTYIPEFIKGIESVKKHVCGSEHNLALTDNGCIYSWGWNEHGICATGDEENVLFPQKISALQDDFVVDIGSAAGHSFCIEIPKES